MIEELKKIIPKIKGKILVIGFDFEILSQVIEENDSITYCDFLNSEVNTKEQGTGGTIVNIRKLRKKYKKKKLDYLFVNMDEVNKYISYFVKDSVYICKQKIYIFNNTNPELIKKYQRYDVKVNNKKFKNGNFDIIDTSNATNKMVLDKIYFISDIFVNLLNKISDFLVS